MSEQKLPPEVQQAIVEYENLRNMLARTEADLELVKSELATIEEVLANIKDLPKDTEFYKLVGHVLFRKDRDSLIKELNERKEFLQLKQQKYQNQINELRRRVAESEKRLRDLLAKYGIKIG